MAPLMKEKRADGDDELTTVPTQGMAEVLDLEGYTTNDAVFGEITEGGANYRNVGWLGTVALMMKTQIGLGVLSIPVVFDALGLVPGLICMYTIAVMTTWSDYIIGVFKLNHPEVYSIDDVGELVFGKTGRVVMGTAFYLYWVFVAGSGMLSISIGLNSLSSHGTCTAVFVAVAFAVAFGLASIRTLGRITPIAWIGLFGILASIITLTVAVGVEDRPAAAPQEGPWVSDFKIVNNPSFSKAISAVSSLVFAYAGTPAFFGIASEMRNPRLYTKSLIICQVGVTVIYTAIGVVVYYYCGSYVASPALGSASALMKKVCYGLALPGLIATTTLTTHLPAKYVFVRLLRGSKHLNSNSATHWSIWIGCTFATAMISYIIASAIPNFGGLVSLIGALLGTSLSLQPMACMWLYDNWKAGKQQPSVKWKLMVCWCVFIIVAGTFLMVAGTYGSIVDIVATYAAAGNSAAWSCADNSV